MTNKKRIQRLAKQLRKGWGISFILSQKCAKDVINNYGVNVINLIKCDIISVSVSDDIYQDITTIVNINGHQCVLQDWGV